MTTRMSLTEFKAIGQTKRSKYNALRCEVDGHKFDSRAEASYYQELKVDPSVLHVDVHPTVTLPGGVRYRLDFIVWRRACGYSFPKPLGPSFWMHDGRPEPVEIKGVITPDFRIKRKLFDQYHPLAPLKVLRETRKGWEAI